MFPEQVKDLLIKTSLLDEYPYVNKHTIVVGKQNSNLYDLIKALRAKNLGNMRYIGEQQAITQFSF